MAKKRRRVRSLFKDDRQLIAMAATGAIVEDAAAKLDTPVETIQTKARRLGISIKNGRLTKRRSAKPAELGLKVKK